MNLKSNLSVSISIEKQFDNNGLTNFKDDFIQDPLDWYNIKQNHKN